MVTVKIPDGYYMQHVKYEMYPNEMQAEFIDRCINTSRFVYNWALGFINDWRVEFLNDADPEIYINEFPGKYTVQREFTKLRNNPDYAFLKDLPHISARNAVDNACNSISMYKKGICKYPKYKTKKNSKLAYKTRFDTMYFHEDKVKIEGCSRIDLKINTGKHSTDNIVYYNPTITKDNTGRYWISCGYLSKKKINPIIPNSEVKKPLGIDLNVKKRFVFSNGEVIWEPNAHRLENRYKRAQRRNRKDINRRLRLEKTNPESKDCQISKRARKRELNLSRLSKKLNNVEINCINQAAAYVIKQNPAYVVMEHLEVKSMMPDKYSGKKLGRAKFYEAKVRIKHKCEQYNIPFIEADRQFPSSQLCSCCGNRQHIGKSRKYICPICGLEIDRDLNAAINLSKYKVYNSAV